MIAVGSNLLRNRFGRKVQESVTEREYDIERKNVRECKRKATVMAKFQRGRP